MDLDLCGLHARGVEQARACDAGPEGRIGGKGRRGQAVHGGIVLC